MKKRNIKIISLFLVALLILFSFSGIFVSCNNAIKIEVQPSLITQPVQLNKNTKKYELLNKEKMGLDAPNPIDFKKNDPKEVIAKAWKNMYYAPFLLSRQGGAVTTLSAGTTVIQNVSTYRMAIRGNKIGKTDSGKDGLEQSINYMQSNSVTSQGIPGIDIRLMIEALRNSQKQYFYRAAKDKNNIKLDVKTSEFYNMTGRWESGKANDLTQFHSKYSKDDPNDIIAYNVSEESIDAAKELTIDQVISKQDQSTEEGKQKKTEYETLKQQIEAKQSADVHFYQVRFNSKAWEGTYLEIMYDMLHLGGQSGKIDYLGLNMLVEVWENGYLRQIDFSEKYDIDLGSLKANATLNSIIEFSYQRNQVLKAGEKPVDWPRKYLDRFMKKFKSDRKPPISVDKSALK